MNQRAFSFLLPLAVLLAGQPVRAADPPAPVSPPAKDAFQIYVLMGQSNMAGRDTRRLASQIDNPRVLAMTPDGEWVVARDPIHPRQGRTEPGSGPGMSFAFDMVRADPTITIGLVPCAVGGSPLRRWVKGGDLYAQALGRIKAAAGAGQIKGVLWHQGESDSDKKQNADTYGARLAGMIKDLRQDLRLPGLPIVVGQLGEFLPPGKFPHAGSVRAAIKRLPLDLPGVGYADSAGLGDKGDRLHFSAEAEQQLGARFAAAMRQLQAPTSAGTARAPAPGDAAQVVRLDGGAGGKRFDGIGVVNGGGATSVLLKDYPEPQRSQILDLVYKPKFGASVSALLVEIPGDGNSTQGSMPSHMHTRDDLDHSRGYIWWVLREAKSRNPRLTLDATAWSAPGWVGNGQFWSQDAADYYVKWLQGLRTVHGLELDAIGCRNEKGVSLGFAKTLRATLDANGFKDVKLHAFDNWPKDKFDFVKDLAADAEARDAIDILSAHVMYANDPAPAEVREMAARMGKPIWNTEDHVYKKGFDCQISIVECFNENFLRSGATKVVNWYDIAGVYPVEPYAEDPAMLLARSPWSGHYQVREALWGYAHYGQFTEAGWQYLDGGCGDLAGGGTFVAMKSPADDYSIIIETKDAKTPQQVRFQIGGGLSAKELCVWRSNAREQFIQQSGIKPVDGSFGITLEPDTIYSLSTTTGQRKGSFAGIPAPKPFPFPYYETFDGYSPPKDHGHLPRYTADIAGAFEIAARPDNQGQCLRQVVPAPTISWAPDWLPYTIVGDDQWCDYEVAADVYLNPGESAAVMGRVNHVGTGYGFIPKGYFLELADDGRCRLVVVRGKPDKKKPVGDAEQQALLKAGKDDSEGGEMELASVRLAGIGPNQWHHLKLRMEGATLTGLVAGKPVVRATDALYPRGMVGLMAGKAGKKFSMPYFDNLRVNRIGAPVPPPSTAAPGQSPIYGKQPPARAQQPDANRPPHAMVDVWPEGRMPGRGARDPEGARSPEKTDAKRITNISRPTLSFFPAPVEGAAAPAVIVCPGGGYNYVVYDKEGTEIAAWLNSAGIHALVLKYRVPHNRDGALQDLQRSLALVRTHAVEWKIDPKRVGVIGFSAGGNLAAKASTRFGERAYQAVDAADQQSCRPDFAMLVYPAYLDDKNGHVAPDLDLKAAIPPTLIVHSEDDKTFVAGSKLYAAALGEAKVTHELKLYPSGGHGYGLRCTRDARAWPQDALQWLHETGVR